MRTPRGCTSHICRMPEICLAPRSLQATTTGDRRKHTRDALPTSQRPNLHLRTNSEPVRRFADLAFKASCILPRNSTHSRAFLSHQLHPAHPHCPQLAHTQHSACRPNLGRCPSATEKGPTAGNTSFNTPPGNNKPSRTSYSCDP
jgi:hypothetical protein